MMDQLGPLISVTPIGKLFYAQTGAMLYIMITGFYVHCILRDYSTYIDVLKRDAYL